MHYTVCLVHGPTQSTTARAPPPLPRHPHQEGDDDLYGRPLWGMCVLSSIITRLRRIWVPAWVPSRVYYMVVYICVQTSTCDVFGHSACHGRSVGRSVVDDVHVDVITPVYE